MVPYNRSIFNVDNLEILKEIDDACIDLIYMDPPFNSEKDYVEFNDQWHQIEQEEYKDITQYPFLYSHCINAEVTHSTGMKHYLIMMSLRLLECYRILQETGSIFIHCDQYSNAYLRIILNYIFTPKNFRNEIVWCYTGAGNVQRYFPRKHDTIYFYVKSNKSRFNREDIRIPYKALANASGFSTRMNKERLEELRHKGKVPESWWVDVHPCIRNSPERVGYPTQKPTALLHRIIKCASNPGDLVLDPFCGSGTTLVAAEELQRRWCGIDVNKTACQWSKERINGMGIEINNIETPKED